MPLRIFILVLHIGDMYYIIKQRNEKVLERRIREEILERKVRRSVALTPFDGS